MAAEIDAVVSAFINVAADAPDHMVFVLDDYHLIDDPAVHRAVAGGLRLRNSVASSSDLRPGANCSQSSRPKYACRAPVPSTR